MSLPQAAAEAAETTEQTQSRPLGAGPGVMLGWHEKSDNVDLLRARERELGTRFAVVRLYNQWKMPGRKVDEMVADGRLVLSSHKPPSAGWRAVASGAEDETARALAREYRAYGRQIVFIFHHEPHDDASDVKNGSSGTAAEYRAAFRRLHRIFVEEQAHVSAGGNVLFGYSATGSRALAGNPPGSADRLYPGDDVVDLFAHDRYNWAGCRDDDWESFSENWKPLVALAAAHGKALIPAEFGSAPSRGGHSRNEWFREAAQWMKTDPLARRWMIGFAYYHSFHDSCHWDFANQDDDGRQGWTGAFGRDPYFRGTPFALSPFAAPPQDSAPPVDEPSGPPPSETPSDNPPAPEEPPAGAPPAEPEGAPSWGPVTRTPGGLPGGLGETSGFAASRRHAGWAWGVRDSGNPASIYALRRNGDGAGRFSSREVRVRGASNRDWEDLVYAEEAGSSFLYVVDTGAKRIYKLAEPDPAAAREARVAAVYRYAFPDASPRGCGPRHNVEAAFAFPAVTGPLHLVRKAKDPAGVYRFDRLVEGRTNVPVKVGSLSDASCISVAAVSADNRFLVTASHSSLRVREGNGDLASLLRGPVVYTRRIDPDNNEGGDWFPWGSRDIVVVAENRSTWHLAGAPRASAAEPAPAEQAPAEPAPAEQAAARPAPEDGVMPGWHERVLGKRFALVRFFEQWLVPRLQPAGDR